PLAVVATARAVLVPHPRDGGRLEETTAAKAPVEEQVSGHARKWPAEPLARRRLEALLGALDDRAWQPALQQAPEQIFAGVAAQLQRGRHPRRELEQPMIEQRLARLERHRHAHLVDFRQDVI